MSLADKPTVNLYDMRGIGIIIQFPSGVLYSNQTGGYSCLHPIEEGVFAPLAEETVDYEAKLLEYFTGPKWKGCCNDGIDVATANFIDELLLSKQTTKFIKVDRSRIPDSHEAWIYVDLEIPTEQVSLIDGFGTAKGVLTWPNSD